MRALLPVLNVLGVVLMAFAPMYLLPLATSLIYDDGTALAFGVAMLIDLAAGALLWAGTRGGRDLRPRDGYLLVTLAWVFMGGAATIPFFLSLPGLSATDVFFETMSALTTTGSTVISGLEYLPPSVNLWRHALQWYGGMGIIVLAIAILPLLGIGGMQLYRAEMPGAYKDKLTPRITDTAKALWLAYTALTLACMLALRLAGMSWFDAVNHGFSAVALGGFSTRDASIGHYDSAAIEAVLVFFMVCAAMNFASHFAALRQRSMRVYFGDAEAKALLAVIAVSWIVVSAYLWMHGYYPDFGSALRHAGFNLVSVVTTTGYASADYSQWPPFAVFLVLLLACGTCSTGSTGNGIKMFRTLMLVQQAARELKRLIHPQVIAPLRFGSHVVPNAIVYAILAFIFFYFVVIVGVSFVLMASGMEVVTAFSASIAWINNIGPALNEIGPAGNFSHLTDFQKWVGIFAMLTGRLELFTVRVLFTPAFWRK